MKLGLAGKVVAIAGGNDTDLGRAAADAFRAEGCAVAVTDWAADADAFVRSVLTDHDRIDAALNVPAARSDHGAFHEQDEEHFDDLLESVVRATFAHMRAQLRAMSAGGGSIVNVASSAGIVGVAESAIASAMDHAVIGLTRTAAVEYGSRRIRVNALCPPFAGAAGPLGEIGVADLVNAAVWLCSPASGAVTGTCLQADGGLVETEGQLGKH